MATTDRPNRRQVKGPGHAGIYGPVKTDITDGGTNLFNVEHGAGTSVAFRVTIAIHADDGTDFQAYIQEVYVASVNKAGAWTTDVQNPAAATDEAKAVSAGTLTTAYALSSADPAVFSVTPTGSLTETTYTATWSVEMLSDHAVTIL